MFEKVINKIVIKKLVQRGNRKKRELDETSLNAIEISESTLIKLIEENKDTEYGRLYNFDQIKTVEDYQRLVPLSYYDDYEPYISRMVKNGETGLITNRKIVHYALSSGSVGVPKHIPVSEEEVEKYCGNGVGLMLAVASEYYRDTSGHTFHSGRGFNTVEISPLFTELGIPKGAISGTAISANKKFLPYMFSSPWEVLKPNADMDMKYLKLRFALIDEDIFYLLSAFVTGLVDIMDYLKCNWELLCDDIEKGTINKTIRIPEEERKQFEAMLVPNKKRADQLRNEFEAGFDTPIIPRIWPKVKLIAAIGTGGFSAYRYKMWKYSGKRIPYNNLMYGSSESLMAVARHLGDTSFVLIPNGGFYEFIPTDYMDDPTFTPLTIKDLKENETYEILITNLSGLYRYRIKDVIRVKGFYNEAPMIEFVYRANQMLSIAGEKTNEEAIRWSVDEFIKETGIIINDYSVYADIDTEPGHYVFLMEPDSVVPQEQIAHLRDVIEAKVSHANPSYGAKVVNGILGPMELVFVQQQTYQLYRELMITKGVSQNQLKPVRVIDTPIKKNFFFGLKE